MTFKKNFSIDTSGFYSPISGNIGGKPRGFVTHNNKKSSFYNYRSNLEDVYTGHPNRIDRYNQYETMDMDSEVHASLNIIAEFSTQLNTSNYIPFELKFSGEPTSKESEILVEQLKHWCRLQEINRKIFKIFRNTIKYGDQIFIRDPETYKLYWVDPINVARVIVNNSHGKEPAQYILKDLDPNFENMTVAPKTATNIQTQMPPSGFQASPTYGAGNIGTGGSRFSRSPSEVAIDAHHIVHLSLTEGLDFFWPFGVSILEDIQKVYKQKELIEDAIIIYRIQRAPERRVFNIDTGDLPNHLAMAYVEQFINELHQRRIPSRNGTGDNYLDTTYNPLSINQDYFFPKDSQGRGSTVDTLPGGQNLNDIDDLRIWNNKIARGLRVPASYLPSGPNDSADNTGYNDGRLGTALIQELMFNNYCERLQNTIIYNLNKEFKLFLAWRGYEIDNKLFDIRFNPPQNFASSRQSELDSLRLGNFSSAADIPYLSKRFALKKYLCLNEDEMKENERMWKQENDKSFTEPPRGSDLRGVGVNPVDMDADLDNLEGFEVDTDQDFGDLGGEGPEIPEV